MERIAPPGCALPGQAEPSNAKPCRAGHGNASLSNAEQCTAPPSTPLCLSSQILARLAVRVACDRDVRPHRGIAHQADDMIPIRPRGHELADFDRELMEG